MAGGNQMSTVEVRGQFLDIVGVDRAKVDALRSALRGSLLQPGDDGYEKARTIWNEMIDHRPNLIVRCAGVSDVIVAVNFARINELLVSVRGGGHNVSGNAVCNGGLMIDLSMMTSVHVDAKRKIARAEGGATWKDYDRETQVFGLASTGGAVSRTGIAGLTLGGGWGWLGGRHGLACDNLLSADVVTADGQLVTASADQNENLFWGLRGGGGNFGVVTSFEYKVHPVHEVFGGVVWHPMESAREVLLFYDEFTESCSDDLVSLVQFVTLPDGSLALGVEVCYFGGVQKGEEYLRPLREFGSPIGDDVGPTTYVDYQQASDEAFPEKIQNYWKSNFLKRLDARSIDVLIDYAKKIPTPESVAMIEQVGNGVRRVGTNATAFNHREARYSFLICGMTSDPENNTQIVSWTQEFFDAMTPFTDESVYVNYLGSQDEEGDDRVLAAYGARKYERLVKLKNKYDPSNLFRLNQNVKPTLNSGR